MSAPPIAAAAASSPSAPAAAPSDLPSWNDVPYLLQQYYHDDPKKLNDFRLPELDALAQLAHAPKCYTKSEVLYSSPFLRARFPSEAHMKAMAARAILVTRWTELWGEGATFEECLADFASRRNETRIQSFTENSKLTFDLRIHHFGLTPSQEEMASWREATLKSLACKGTSQYGSNMVETKFFLFFDFGSKVVNPSRVVRRVYLTREICGDKFNTLENDYRLNARVFIGPTSMPANLSFIMSNLGQVTKNSVVYDPFVGTGSLLVSAGHFGALCIGSDLDWKILHGKTRKGPISVRDNFKQYKLKQPEILCSDLSVNHWRSKDSSGFIDAIVCDPPYGVRAGARKSGRAEGKEVRSTAAYQGANHVPTTQLYDVEDVIHDMLDQSAQLLRLGGRLIYWLPTTTDFGNDELPQHPCLKQISVCEQVVRSHFSRRLITMEKVLEFNETRKMFRRNKLTDQPPKYANLKETIQALSDEGPDRTVWMDTSTGGAAAAAASASPSAADGSTPVPEFDPSSSFAPRPISRSALKKLSKLEHIAARKQQEAAENGGKRPSRRERIAAKERLPTEVWKERQKERNLQVAAERSGKKRTGSEMQSNAVDPSDSSTTPAASASSSAAHSADHDTDSMEAESTALPPSPPITQPAKKARLETGEEAGDTL